jgi:hypothetical protein
MKLLKCKKAEKGMRKINLWPIMIHVYHSDAYENMTTFFNLLKIIPI